MIKSGLKQTKTDHIKSTKVPEIMVYGGLTVYSNRRFILAREKKMVDNATYVNENILISGFQYKDKKGKKASQIEHK